MGPLSDAERSEQLERSPFKGRFDQAVDRDRGCCHCPIRFQLQGAGQPDDIAADRCGQEVGRK